VEEPLSKKEALFDSAEVGETFGPLEMVVDDHKIKAFAFTQDDYHPWYFSGSPFGGRIGHSALLANDLLQLYHLNYAEYGASRSVGLHTGEELWFHAPVFLDEKVVMEGHYVDKYERRGKGYVVMEAEARGADGRLLVRHRGTEIMRVEAGQVVGARSESSIERQVTGNYLTDVEPAKHARTGLVTGTPVSPLAKQARADQMAVYSMISPFSKNIHTDLEAAQAAGLRLPIMQGQQQMSFMCELMAGYFGEAWFTSGWVKAKFTSPVYAFENLSIRAAVSGESLEAGGARQELEVWVEDGKGAKTAVGWASAKIADRVG
jgi:acyl dehydratase